MPSSIASRYRPQRQERDADIRRAAPFSDQWIDEEALRSTARTSESRIKPMAAMAGFTRKRSASA